MATLQLRPDLVATTEHILFQTDAKIQHLEKKVHTLDFLLLGEVTDGSRNAIGEKFAAESGLNELRKKRVRLLRLLGREVAGHPAETA